MNIELSIYLGLVSMGAAGVALGYGIAKMNAPRTVKDIESEATLTSFYAGQEAEAPYQTDTMSKARTAAEVSEAPKRKRGRPRKNPIE